MDSCDHYDARVAAAASTTLAGHIPCTLVSVPDKETADQVKVVARARFERECLRLADLVGTVAGLGSEQL